MNEPLQVIDVTLENVEKTGFFCYMSARKSEGFAHKLDWVKARLAEGLKIKMVLPPHGRGFIEYIPGEFTWRAVNAAGYMFIHCIWVVGKSKGSGVASHLLKLCEQDAAAQGMNGVAMVTSGSRYMVKPGYLEKKGYRAVDQAPPSFTLMVKKFKEATDPVFCGDWEAKARRFGKGLTVVRSDQCPYLESAAQAARSWADGAGLEFRDVILQSAVEVREIAPSAYAVYNLIYNGILVGDQYMGKEAVLAKIKEIDSMTRQGEKT